jgi:fused signal recognition particle receptor
MFGLFKNKAHKIYTHFTQKLSSIFARNKLDDEFLNDLSRLLITADTGVKTTQSIIKQLQQSIEQKTISSSQDAKQELEHILLSLLPPSQTIQPIPSVILLVGVNGSGKTTFASKFAHQLKKEGKKVMLVAADTFRAAAIPQLQDWAHRIGVTFFAKTQTQDPASVVFDACLKGKRENFDHIIIDTAGRLQTKVNLMYELEKIRKVIIKQLPDKKINTWITIDAMLGQNSLLQAQTFNKATKLDGIILTKLDNTGKGGIIFSITDQLKCPITFITFGEKVEEIRPFDPVEYVKNLLENES